MLNNYVDYEENYEIETNSTVSINSSDSGDSWYEYSISHNNNSNNNNISIISSKYTLLIPEIFNEHIHGITLESDPTINEQLLVHESFTIKTNTCIGELLHVLKKRCKFYNKCYKVYHNNVKHNYIRNYNNIITRCNYMKPEIGEIYYLRGNECVCILKTFWLKIIQRAWKKIYKLRQQIFKLRSRPDSILYKQISGKYFETCRFMPSIRGMLAHI